MKIYHTFILCCLFVAVSALPSLGTGALHTFTTTDGRSLKATVLDFNASSKKIQIEREDGKKIWVRPSVFSQPDRDYVQRWIAADQFMSPTKFRIKGKKLKGKTSKSTSRIMYEITLENKTGFPLNNLKIEYRTFVLKKILNKENGEQEEDSSRVDGGGFNINIPVGKKISKTTAPTILDTEFRQMMEGNTYTGFDYYKLKVSEEELEGFWIKIHGPEIDGTRAVREWCNPADTIENFSWQDKTPTFRQRMAMAGSTPNQPRKIDPAEEIERLTKLYEKHPSANTAKSIGYAYVWKLKPPNISLGLEWLEKAAAKNNLPACRLLANIYSTYYGDRQYYSLEKTIQYAQQALSIEPGGPTAHVMMAKAYAVDGQFDKAVEHQKLAVELFGKKRGAKSQQISSMERILKLYQDKKVR